jgi:hypothetical protein
MSSSESRRGWGLAFLGTRARQIAAFPVALATSTLCPLRAEAQQPPQGFAVERFYPSAAAGGWFVMDDLNIDGGLGGAVAFTTGYSRKPLEVTSPDGTQRLSVVSNEAFVDVSLAATYRRYRVYLDLPMPLLVTGTSGTIGPYQLSAPAVDVGTNPDTISDARVGFDMRLLGQPGRFFRVGVGAQLIIPSGTRDDYVTDGTFREMVRFLAAGDAGHFSYAGQVGLHIRPVGGSPAPGSPSGNELLFGLSAGRRFSVGPGWAVVIGPEVYGATAFHSFFGGATGVEGLVTGRLEGTGDGRRLRLKLGAGRGLDPHFGAPEWRIVFGVELFGQQGLKRRDLIRHLEAHGCQAFQR